MSAIMSAEKARLCEDLDELERQAGVSDPQLAKLIRAYRLVYLLLSTENSRQLVIASTRWPDINVLLEDMRDQIRAAQETANGVIAKLGKCGEHSLTAVPGEQPAVAVGA